MSFFARYPFDGVPANTVLLVGTIDSTTPSADGAAISGHSLIMQSASVTVPGLINLTTQSFLGAKTFNTSVASPILKLNGSISGVLTLQASATTASYTVTMPSGQGAANTFLKNDGSGGMSWAAGTGASGVDSIGTIDSQVKSADGLVIVATTLYAQTADASFPGLVSTGTQTMAGAKTFSTSVKSPAFISSTANPASAGALRLANTNAINWRNAANGGDLGISLDASDIFQIGSAVSVTGALSATGNISGANLSGTNTGDLTLAAVGAAPSANGATLSGQVLTLQPADATHPGLMTTGTQTIAGAKTFSGGITATLTGSASGNLSYTPNNHGVLVSGSANVVTVIAPDASATKVLKSGGNSADPSWLAYDNANTVSTLVFRDSSGNFSAGTISAALTGTASGNTTYSANNHGLVVSSATNAMTVLSPAVAGTLLTGQGVSADPSFSSTPTLGIAGTTKGTLSFSGNTSGTITVQPQAAAGSYNFNLPITAGNSGEVLTSAGGGSSAMTWSAALINPMTTAGDIVVGGASGAATRLAIGSSGQVLGVSAGAPAWVNNATWNRRSVTTTDSPTGADTVLDLSGASFALTLPDVTAAGVDGKILVLNHQGTNFTQQYTLNTTSAQPIKTPSGSIASGSYKMCSKGEVLMIQANATNGCWDQLYHYADTGWIDCGNFANFYTFTITSGSATLAATYVPAWVFTITSGSATVGATYTNNGQTFTVSATIASQLTLVTTSPGSPAASGTLAKASGTGDANITFSAVAGATNAQVFNIAQTIASQVTLITASTGSSPNASGRIVKTSGTGDAVITYSAVSGSAYTIGGTTTAPIYYGAPTLNKVYLMRRGNYGTLWVQLYQATAGNAGSGDYLHPMPSGVLIDSAVTPLYTGGAAQTQINTTPATMTNWLTMQPAGGVASTNGGSYMEVEFGLPYTTSSYRVLGAIATSPWFCMGSSNMQASAIMMMNYQVTFPIQDWQP